MYTIKRKAVVVSIYYYGDEPSIELEDWDAPDSLFLSDVISVTMERYNPKSEVFDVAIDETKPWLFGIGHWWSKYIYRFIRR